MLLRDQASGLFMAQDHGGIEDDTSMTPGKSDHPAIMQGIQVVNI